MDYGHEQTDRELKKLERRLAKEYDAAKKSVEQKLKKHLEQYDELDKQYAKMVEDGKMKKKTYLRWRNSAMVRTKAWEDLRDTLASDLSHTNEIAMGMINDHAIDCYALNMNYGTYEIENGYHAGTSFSMYDHRTVENLMRDNPQIIPQAKMDIPEDLRWNRQKLTSAITQGVLTGDSIPDIARRLGGVADMNETAAIRNARTYTTAAENKGRTDSYIRAQNMGIELEQEWIATLDQRTRSSHRHLDGERVKIGAKFSNGCRYPGDPEGRPEEIYNCRCTLVAALKGYDYHDDRFSRLPSNMSYEEWKIAKDREAHPSKGIVNGRDISSTWNRRQNQFPFAIDDAINAQGFDGLPRVVSPDEFERAVKVANSGNGFVAQRTYSAPDKDALDAYRDQLRNGKWYVDCSTGGSVFGQGMYCAGGYGYEMSNSAKNDIKQYQNLAIIRNNFGETHHKVENLTIDPSAKIVTSSELQKMMGQESYADDPGVFATLKGFDVIDVDDKREPNSFIILNRTKLIIRGD